MNCNYQDMGHKEAKVEAGRLIQWLEDHRVAYEQAGYSLAHYVLVPTTHEVRDSLYDCVAGVGIVAIVFMLLIAEPQLAFMIGLLAALVCVISYLDKRISEQKYQGQCQVSWGIIGLDMLDQKRQEIDNCLKRHTQALEMAQPWIEKIERIKPIIVDELSCKCELLTLRDEFKVQITVNEEANEETQLVYPLDEQGYNAVVLWILGERDRRARLIAYDHLIQEFESTLG